MDLFTNQQKNFFNDGNITRGSTIGLGQLVIDNVREREGRSLYE